jgi:hypothetical protein
MTFCVMVAKLIEVVITGLMIKIMHSFEVLCE